MYSKLLLASSAFFSLLITFNEEEEQEVEGGEEGKKGRNISILYGIRSRRTTNQIRDFYNNV